MVKLFKRFFLGISILFSLTCLSTAGILTIAQDGSGGFRSIQAAVDKAKPYDTLMILDAAEYREQVTVQAPLHHVTLTTRDAGNPIQPVIRWRDTRHVGPRTCEESLVDSTVDYDKNGALRLLNVRDVAVEGITIDADSVFVDAWDNVWPLFPGSCIPGKWPQLSGNAALVLFHCANVRVRDCRLAHGYYGALIKERDAAAPFVETASTGGSPSGLLMALGNHSFIGNTFMNNSWGVYFESAWGLGSTFRDNLFWRNHHADSATAQKIYDLPGGHNLPGGVFSFKDVRQSAMTIMNNTFAENFLFFAAQDNAGAQHLAAGNVFARPYKNWSAADVAPYSSPWQDLSPVMPHRMKFNTFASQLNPSHLDSMRFSAYWIDSVTRTVYSADTTVKFLRAGKIMNGLSFPEAGEGDSIDVTVGTHTVRVRGVPAGFTRPGAFISYTDPYSPTGAPDGNRWYETAFPATDPTAKGFLGISDTNAAWLKTGWGSLGYRTRTGDDAGLGAVEYSSRAAEIRITPLAPANGYGDSLIARFTIELPGQKLPTTETPRLQYCRLTRKVLAAHGAGNTFGPSGILISEEAEPLSVEGVNVKFGFNELRMPWPGPARDTAFNGFVAMAVRTSGGYSNIAQFPILNLQPLLKIEILDSQAIATPAAKTAAAALAGLSLRIRIATRDGSPFQAPIVLTTASGAPIVVGEISDTARDSSGNYSGPLPLTLRIQLAESPASGTEMLLAGAWDSSTHRQYLGTSPAIVIARQPVGIIRPARSAPSPTSVKVRPARNILGRTIPAGHGKKSRAVTIQ